MIRLKNGIFLFFLQIKVFLPLYCLDIFQKYRHFAYLCIMNVHIFNPEHDMALAANSAFWTAPHAGRQLRSDLGWLPVLWAEDGDVVVVDDVRAAVAATRKLKVRHADVEFLSMDDKRRIAEMMSGVERPDVRPWGWDISVASQLRRAGFGQCPMPDAAALEKLRALSGRSTAARLLKHLRDNDSRLVGESVVVESMAQLYGCMKEWGRIVVKSPWSCSGRGVRYLSGNEDNILRWAEKTLRQCGHVTAEPFYAKVLDFGMEFSIENGGEVRYDGLSLFSTVAGAYTGNVLATEAEKMEILNRYIDTDTLAATREAICQWMGTVAGDCHKGPFGVDMMVVCDGEKDDKGKAPASDSTLRLHPCVEINLRRTMGHVALAISPDKPLRQQNMRILYEANAYHLRIEDDFEMLY